jgi:hypothetical protein
MRRIVAIALALLLAGCATKASVQDGQKLGPDEGFLALHISSNVGGNLWYTDYSATNSFATRFMDNMTAHKGVNFSQGERYVLLNVRAGDYMWHQFNSGQSSASLRSSNRFRILPGKVTYVGHLQVEVAGSRFRLRARDDGADMQRYLGASYPEISRTHPFEKQLAEFGLKSE